MGDLTLKGVFSNYFPLFINHTQQRYNPYSKNQTNRVIIKANDSKTLMPAAVAAADQGPGMIAKHVPGRSPDMIK